MTLDTRIADQPGPWQIERIEPGSASRRLPGLVRRADFTIAIAPETRGTLRQLAASIARAGGTSLGSSPEAIDLVADKLRLAGHLTRVGVPSPRAIQVEPRLGLPPDAAYPAILKPVDGAGCLDTLHVADRDDPIVSSFSGEIGMLQPFVRGEARSATFLARPDGPPILLGVALQSITIDDSRLAYRGGTILTDDLPRDHPARCAVASVPGLSGLVGVDYIQNGIAFDAVIIEINPRPTTSCVGLVASLDPGRLAEAWLDSAEGTKRVRSSPRRLPGRTTSFRADGSIFAGDPAPTSESIE